MLDLAELTTTFDNAFAVAAAACQRRLTTSDRILQAMSRRGKLRWRTDLVKALDDIALGIHSVLEYRYVNRVERPHGLPVATRQVRVGADGRNRYLDNLYEDYKVCVKLDGRQAHPEDQRWLDQRCETAVQLASVLHSRGWTGSERPCGSGCPVGRPTKQS